MRFFFFSILLSFITFSSCNNASTKKEEPVDSSLQKEVIKEPVIPDRRWTRRHTKRGSIYF